MKSILQRFKSFFHYGMLIMISLLLFNSAQATIYYVNDASTTGDVFCTAVGNNSNDGKTASTPKLTLKNLWTTYGPSGINILTSGDIIKIDVGTYSADGGGNSVDEHQFTISVNGLTFLGAGVDKTIFDHNNGGSASDFFMYINANNITIQDMTLREFDNNGTQTPGHSGQVFTISGTGIIINNVYLTKNGKSGGNPAISVLANSTVTIDGGGSTCNIYNTMYTGGIEAYGKNITLTVKNYILAYNYKVDSYNGGGILIDGDNTTNVTLSNCRITGNVAVEGGGIAMYDGVLKVNDCIIESNAAGQTSTTVYGGGAYINAGTAKFSKCKFINNATTSTVRGGGIAARYITLSGSGFSSNKISDITVDSCVFTGNAGTTNGRDVYGYGGSYACNITMNDCQFYNTGNYNIVNGGSATINITYFGTAPSASGTVTSAPSSNTLYTPNPSPPSYTGDCSSEIVLPVELAYFKGECYGDKVKISWATASETNNNFFKVEKSTDAENWNIMSLVNGAGNSNEFLSYSAYDENSGNTRNYYRLKQTDYDGKFTYSDVISVAPCYEGYFDMTVANNPVKDIMNVLVNSSYNQNMNVQITDMLGRNVYSERRKLDKGDNTFHIDVSALRSGIYILSAEPELSGQSAVKKVMINYK